MKTNKRGDSELKANKAKAVIPVPFKILIAAVGVLAVWLVIYTAFLRMPDSYETLESLFGKDRVTYSKTTYANGSDPQFIVSIAGPEESSKAGAGSDVYYWAAPLIIHGQGGGSTLDKAARSAFAVYMKAKTGCNVTVNIPEGSPKDYKLAACSTFNGNGAMEAFTNGNYYVPGNSK